MVTKERLIKILAMPHMAYHLVVCNGALKFAAWSAGAEGGTPVSRSKSVSLSVHILGSAKQSQVHPQPAALLQSTLVTTFSQQLPHNSFPLLICPPLWLAAKSLTRDRGRSARFRKNIEFLSQGRARNLKKWYDAYRIRSNSCTLKLAGRPKKA